jgi:YidC/Oxa1 family membrane protein insertase
MSGSLLAALVASPLTPLEDALRAVLDWLHTTIGLPWAWAIVVITLLVRMLLVPLTVRQIHSMQNMQRFAPQMKEIQKRYKGDRQKQNEELMKFYKEHNINPAASCLPMLVQIPIFFALYFVLKDFDKNILTQPKYKNSDLGWLDLVPNITHGVTTHWSGYLLVVIYTASQISSTYFMSTTMDRTQRILFMILPLGFVFFILSGSAFFPAGLLLYWVTTNLWTVGQGLVTRRLVPRTAALEPPKRSSRTPPGGGKPKDDGSGNGGSPARPNGQPPAPAAPRPVKRKKRARR